MSIIGSRARAAAVAVAAGAAFAAPAAAQPRVRLTLEDGTHVEGELAGYEDGTYQVVVGGRTLDFAEGEVRAVAFVRGGAAEPTPAGAERYDLRLLPDVGPRVGDRLHVARTHDERDPHEEEVRWQLHWVDLVQDLEGERPVRVDRTVKRFRSVHGEELVDGRYTLRRAGPRLWDVDWRSAPPGSSLTELEERFDAELERFGHPLQLADVLPPLDQLPAAPVAVGDTWDVPLDSYFDEDGYRAKVAGLGLVLTDETRVTGELVRAEAGVATVRMRGRLRVEADGKDPNVELGSALGLLPKVDIDHTYELPLPGGPLRARKVRELRAVIRSVVTAAGSLEESWTVELERAE